MGKVMVQIKTPIIGIIIVNETITNIHFFLR